MLRKVFKMRICEYFGLNKSQYKLDFIDDNLIYLMNEIKADRRESIDDTLMEKYRNMGLN